MKHIILSLLLVSSALAALPTKPNVIFILADDLGIGNVGCYGSDRYKTPHIDKLATQGVRFTQCFTAALCGPSRALIMSGRYAFRNGATNQDACTNLDPKEIVLPRLFKAAGYATDPGYAQKIAHILGSETFRNAVKGAAGPVLSGAVMANGTAAAPSARSSGVLSDV